MTKLLQNNYETIKAISSECMVLLKSDGSFPIELSEKVALYGSGARYTLRGGTGGGIVEVKSFTTIEEGLKNVGFEIVSDEWLNGYDAIRQEARANYQAKVKSAIATDGLTALGALSVAMPEPQYDLPIETIANVAVYVLTRVSGEGADRAATEGDIFFTSTEIRDIIKLSESYPKFMLVLNVSGIVDLSPVADKVPNILLLSQLGSATGDAFGDVLSGKTYPSGKLASTWARYEDYSNIGDLNPADDTRYREGIYIGYRYFDAVGKKALYSFGFGLSYTAFHIETLATDIKHSTFTVRTKVSNTGNRLGKEIVQVYVSLPQGKLDQPYQVLAAFMKTVELGAGQSQTLDISFEMEALASFDKDSCCRVLEKGDYIIRVGNSSCNTKPVAIVRLSDTAVVERVTHIGGEADFTDFKPIIKNAVATDSLPVLELSAKSIKETKHKSITIDEKALAFAKSLTDEDLCLLCTGKFEDGNTYVGLGGADVPGAAGQSTLAFKERGIDSIIMADGPAGLHISGQYGVDEKGKYSVVSNETKAVKDMLPPDILKYLLVIFPDAANEDRKGEIHDQYCTALPIEMALAQSWNEEICRQCGEVVASEMEEYGVDINLAPALNMHRHPLCGRNFEYFSEDPLITGKMAAAIVKGVQSRRGRGSMLKHYVCYEQENNRLNSNSIVSERAMRDIYLRAFEIAIKESTPCSVMTSYNLLNGQHTSERKDLMQTVLRQEWGFEGVVVSDWVGFKPQSEDNQKYPRARAYKTVAAGNDLMMPGSKGHYDELLENLRNPSSPLSRKVMEECAARIVYTAWKLKGDN